MLSDLGAAEGQITIIILQLLLSSLLQIIIIITVIRIIAIIVILKIGRIIIISIIIIIIVICVYSGLRAAASDVPKIMLSWISSWNWVR